MSDNRKCPISSAFKKSDSIWNRFGRLGGSSKNMNRVTFSRCNFTRLTLVWEKKIIIDPSFNLYPGDYPWILEKTKTGNWASVIFGKSNNNKKKFWNVWERHFWKKSISLKNHCNTKRGCVFDGHLARIPQINLVISRHSYLWGSWIFPKCGWSVGGLTL